MVGFMTRKWRGSETSAGTEIGLKYEVREVTADNTTLHNEMNQTNSREGRGR